MRYCEATCETQTVEMLEFIVTLAYFKTKVVFRAIAYDGANPANRVAAIANEIALLESIRGYKRATLKPAGKTITADPVIAREPATPAQETETSKQPRLVKKNKE